jgi:transcription antitermination protein NusB
MNARRAARELALLSLFQQNDAPEAPTLSIKDMTLSSVRALSNEAESQIQIAADQLAEISRYMLHLEQESPINLESPIDAPIKPVPIPTTREMIEKIESCLHSAELLFEALRLPEMITLMRQDDVQAYAQKLMDLVRKHQSNLDEQLNRHMVDWRMERLHRMDSIILRLALAEMRFAPKVDLSVSINEAVDLAKQFSSEESYRLVNGVLGSVATEVAQETGKNLHNVYTHPVPSAPAVAQES